MAAPPWVRSAVWWHIYPLGFGGGLRRIERYLDYARELGASGVALGPVFASETHGYDTVDHFRIDSRLGQDSDFDALIAAAHERGLRIALDGVFNHVGRSHPRFLQALEDPAVAREWFQPVGDDFYVWEGHRQLVTLNHDSPAVADYVAAVMTHWLDRGASAWRLDAAYSVPRAFWARVLPRVRASHPEAYLWGEQIAGDYAGLVRDGGLDSVTQYELWKAIGSSIHDHNFFELAWSLKRHQQLLADFVPFTFLGNHDVSRVATRIGDSRHLAHAVVVLFTVAGTPAVYYGDERGLLGVKEDRVGGDDAVRPAYPDRPDELDPAGAELYRLHQRLIGLRRRNPWLHDARTEPLSVATTALAYESLGAADAAQGVTVLLNLADSPAELPTGGRTRLLDGAASYDAERASVPPHGWAVLG
ncbi:alpha-amylase family glycosyl hydrolase [Gryllotalpicola koreensis]|uniref:Alpha-amylase family protein n=1 Tax=Gryllotalpicola koreensis TaxID=993086 RepID=A0ABP8A9Y7_9MICO